MRHKTLERIVDSLSFPLMTSVKGNFFSVVEEVSVAGTIFSFEFYNILEKMLIIYTLFKSCELSERRRNNSEDRS